MAWTATAGKSPVQGTRIVTTVRFTNGIKIVDVDLANDGTKPNLEAQARAYAANRTVDGDATVVPPGTPLDLTEPPPPQPPTQAELDRVAWFKDWATYQGYLRGIDAQLPGMTPTTPQIVSLKASLDAKFLPAYAGSL